MCGIAGAVSLRDGLPPVDLDRLSAMVGALRHRGPDEFGMYRDQRAALGHARLSIIDLSAGQQPLANEDRTIWIVFNGEIFNYIEMREELRAHGHRFNTQSDTEVIVHAYEQWGDEAFRRFNGQWALALWDSTSGTLTLARDPFGVRPLYIAEHDGRLLFASEVKALFALDRSLPRRFDATGLDQLFTFWAPLAPRSVFEGIEELEPGTSRTYAGGRIVRTSRCWSPNYPAADASGFTGSLDEAVERVRHSLENATSLRMLRADVQVGSYLSGGLDSSLIAALGLRAKGSKFSTFSLRFDDAEYDETGHQRTMAAYLGSDHREVLVTRDDIARVFPEAIFHTERPVLRTAPAPMFLLSRLVRDAGIKVVLTGEGADEMFAGYDLFREAKVRRFWARDRQSERRPRLLERLYPYLARSPVSQQAMARQFFGQGLDRALEPGFGHDVRWRAAAGLKRLFAPELRERIAGHDAIGEFVADLPGRFRDWTTLAQDQYVEVCTLLSGYLLSSQGDRMLAGNSVEGRFPFLDRHVAALAESLPPQYKLRVLDEKHVLKRAAEGLVPEAVLQRKKQPYRAPDALSFQSPLADEWIADVASEAALRDAGVFEPGAARRLIDKCRGQARTGQFSNADNMGIVGILSAQLVHHHFMRSAPNDVRPAHVRTLIDHVGEAARTI
jgi:asparagine synthase (glutamine-hydrolysing)